MYSQDGALVLKDGVVLSTVEIVDLLNNLQKINNKWYTLDAEIGKYYENYDEEGEDIGNLVDIGEEAAIAFNYI